VQRFECVTGRDYPDRCEAPGRDGHKIKNPELSTTWSMVGSECLTASHPDWWVADLH
jgi:hypothetical protein